MTEHTNTYPDLVNVEDWLNAKGYTGEAGACHQAMSLIRSQEKRIAELEALVKELADELQVYICSKYVGRKGCPKSKRDEYDAAAEPVRKARDAISVNNQVKFDSSPGSGDLRAALGEKE